MKKSELKQIIREEISKVLDESKSKKHKHTFENFLSEGVKSFFYSKKESEFSGATAAIKKEAKKFLQQLKDEKYTWSDTAFLYFPNFVWAGGRQVFGPSIGILVGSDTIMVRPIGTNKPLKIGDGVLQRLIQRGDLESYSMEF